MRKRKERREIGNRNKLHFTPMHPAAQIKDFQFVFHSIEDQTSHELVQASSRQTCLEFSFKISEI